MNDDLRVLHLNCHLDMICCCLRFIDCARAKDPWLDIKYAFPIFEVSYKTLQLIMTAFYIMFTVNLINTISMFSSAVEIRKHIGRYINFISEGEGNFLPTLQAVPCLFFLLIDVAAVYMVIKSHSPKKQGKLNLAMYVLVLLGIALIAIIFILMIVILSHTYGAHLSLHDGISDAMKNYSTNSRIKTEVDRMQIDLQCCGSKNYDEWYSVKWYDPSLISKGRNTSESQIPFSCCSINSPYPCIHYDVEKTGSVYLYTPEYNLSISTAGCYSSIRKKKQSVGWGIIGKLFLYVVLQALDISLLRFIQTAHFEKLKYEGSTRTYLIWLFGMYNGRKASKIVEEAEETETTVDVTSHPTSDASEQN